MSPAKIKEHEPTAVRRDFTDQKIIESPQQSVRDDDTREKVEKTIADQDQKVPTGTTRLGPRAFHLPGGEILDQTSIPKITTAPLTEEKLDVSKGNLKKK